MVNFKLCLMLSTTLLVGACGQTDDTSTEASTLIATAQASERSAPLALTKNTSEMPEVVRKWVAEKAQECRADGNEFKGLSDAMRKFEFNGDGIADYALWEGGLACEGRDASYFGNAGGQVNFVVSDKGSHELHDGFSIFGWEAWNVQKQSVRDILVIKSGKSEVAWGWNGSTIQMTNRSRTLGCNWQYETERELEIQLKYTSPPSKTGAWRGNATVLIEKNDFFEFPNIMKAKGNDEGMIIEEEGKFSISLNSNAVGSANDFNGAIYKMMEIEDGSSYLSPEVALRCSYLNW